MHIAHLTDLHVSKYGARMTDFHSGRQRAARGPGWETALESEAWRIDYRPAHGRARLYDAFRLIDQHDRVHKVVKSKDQISKSAMIDSLLRLRDLRMQTDCSALARRLPTPVEISRMLQQDPENGNIRFCAVAHALRQHQPDWVVITGDLTDDGVGYDLLLAGLAPFIAQGRLICLPGNHDVYPTPPVWNDKPLRKSEQEKRSLWRNFILGSGSAPEHQLVHDLGENVLLARFDSCHPSRIPGSASGWVPLSQLQTIDQQLQSGDPKALRLACLHHPLLQIPRRTLGLASYQPGMRVRNAKQILPFIRNFGFSVVMNGHRHVGYQHTSPGDPIALGAPSTTYGCRTGAQPFYWCLEILRSAVSSIQPTFIPLLGTV